MGMWTDVHGDALEGADTGANVEGFPFIGAAIGWAWSGVLPALAECSRGGAGMRMDGMDAEGRDSGDVLWPTFSGRSCVPRAIVP
jgi:hypothetical protein